MREPKEFDIALSFAGEDRAYVDQVANILIESGVKVFYDLFEEENLWGKNLYDYLTDVYMNKAVYTIMFISHHYAKKLWTNHERQAMQARAFQESQEYILPLRFDETTISGILPTTGYISLNLKTPSDFADIVHKKLVTSGFTVPSELIRKSLFTVTTIPRVEPRVSCITVISDGHKLSGATVVAIADNDTTKSGSTSEAGIVELTIPTRRSYQLLVAHPNYPAAIISKWDSNDDINVTLQSTESIGSIICMSTGHIPGLSGRLNPILDTSNRMYLYADNIAINGGVTQPATFQINVPLQLEDSDGVIMQVCVMHIQGRTSLIQYAKPRYDC